VCVCVCVCTAHNRNAYLSQHASKFSPQKINFRSHTPVIYYSFEQCTVGAYNQFENKYL